MDFNFHHFILQQSRMLSVGVPRQKMKFINRRSESVHEAFTEIYQFYSSFPDFSVLRKRDDILSFNGTIA